MIDSPEGYTFKGMNKELDFVFCDQLAGLIDRLLLK